MRLLLLLGPVGAELSFRLHIFFFLGGGGGRGLMRMRHVVPEIEIYWDDLNFPAVNNRRDAKSTSRNAALNADILRWLRS